MSELLTQLGIDWKLLISQAVNFLLLLFALRLFVYKPLLKILEERRKKIEEGLLKAQEADVRLRDVNEIAKHKIKEAEGKSMELLQAAEERTKEYEKVLIAKAKEKEATALKDANQRIASKEKDAEEAFLRERTALIKEAITKVTELSPDVIDSALINKALANITE